MLVTDDAAPTTPLMTFRTCDLLQLHSSPSMLLMEPAKQTRKFQFLMRNVSGKIEQLNFLAIRKFNNFNQRKHFSTIPTLFIHFTSMVRTAAAVDSNAQWTMRGFMMRATSVASFHNVKLCNIFSSIYATNSLLSCHPNHPRCIYSHARTHIHSAAVSISLAFSSLTNRVVVCMVLT